MKKFAFTMIFCCVLAGCSSLPRPETADVINPDHGSRQYSRLLVTAEGDESADVLRSIESAAVRELTQGRPELTFRSVRDAITTPLSRKKITEFTKKNNIEGRLKLIVTRNLFKESEELSRELSQGLKGQPDHFTLGLQATLIDVKTNTEIWMGQSSLVSEASHTDDGYVLLGRVIAEQLVETNLLSLE